MPTSNISISCWADPFAVSGTFDFLKVYEYSPLVTEASILNDKTSIERSTEQVKKQIPFQREMKKHAKRDLEQFLESREDFLLTLRSIPKVDSFVRFVDGKAEEIRKSQEEVKRYLQEIGAIQELQRELSREVRLQFKQRDFLINLIRANMNTDNGKLKDSLVNYVNQFNNVLRRLVIDGAKPQTVYTILSADILFIANENRLLRTGQSLAIPLDLSPLRLSLALIDDKELFEQSRRYYPPLFLLYNPKTSSVNLARPYRTLDGHPIFVRAPSFEADKNRAQLETSDARKNFEQRVGPLLYTVKGLAGTRESTPSLIIDPLVQIVQAYISFNPLSRELLRIVDFGCGTGALLRRIFTKVIDNITVDEMINVYALLNDDSQTDPGKGFRRLSLEEVYAGVFDSRAWKGDLRRLVIELNSLEERFDIAFINRVLDMYGGYGIFEFMSSPMRMDKGCSSLTKRMRAREPDVGDVLVFSESACHEDAWRAIKYIFKQQTHEKKNGLYLLPSIDMKMKKNFFNFDGFDILKLTLRISKLLVISVFPGNFRALFPVVNPVKDNIFFCERSSPTSYSVICLSRSKELIDYIETQCVEFTSN